MLISLDVVRRTIRQISRAHRIIKTVRRASQCVQVIMASTTNSWGIGSSRERVAKTRRMQRRSSADVPLHNPAWASLSKMCVPSFYEVCLILSANLQFHRTSPFDAILGGAEDVMGDLGVRQVERKMPKHARL